jgi:hypothetical protein
MVLVKTTRKELSFHVRGRRVSYDDPTLIHYDGVVRRHIEDGSLEIIERNEIPNKKAKKVKNVKS